MRTEELDRIIEKSFRTEPDFHLPVDFTSKIVFAVEQREQWKTNLTDYLNILGIITALILVVAGFYFYIDSKMTLKIFSFISDNLIQVILVSFILNFVLFADRVLLHLLFSKWKRT
jgi:hypothetical protein